MKYSIRYSLPLGMIVFLVIQGCTPKFLVDTGDAQSKVVDANNMELISNNTGNISLVTSSAFEPNADGVAVGISEDARYSLVNSTTALSPETYYEPSGTHHLYRLDNKTGDVLLVSASASDVPISGGVQGYAASVSGLNSYGNFGLSADGRYAVFGTTHSISGSMYQYNPSGINYIYRKDLDTSQVDIVNVASGKNESSVTGYNLQMNSKSISRLGRYIAFAVNDGHFSNTNATGTLVYRKDMQTGTVALVSANVSGFLWDSNPAISDDGSKIIFTTSSSSLYASQATGIQLISYNFTDGKTSLVSKNSNNFSANQNVQGITLSGDGTIAFFESSATNILTTATLGKRQIFAKNLVTGNVTMVSTNAKGYAINADATLGTVSANGRFASFTSAATNVLFGVSGTQVYVKDLATGAIALASANSSGVEGNAASSMSFMSGDGTSAQFSTTSSNLISGASLTQGYLKQVAK